MSDAISFMSPGRPGRRYSDVHFWAISRRDHQRIVSGVTMVATCLKNLATESLAFRREVAALVVSQPDTPPPQLPRKDAVLLHQVVDHVLLVAIDRSSEGQEE
jgi:hypothetical protein